MEGGVAVVLFVFLPCSTFKWRKRLCYLNVVYRAYEPVSGAREIDIAVSSSLKQYHMCVGVRRVPQPYVRVRCR